MNDDGRNLSPDRQPFRESGDTIDRCPRCNRQVLQGWTVCPYCRGDLKETANGPARMHRSPPDAMRICPHCGAESLFTSDNYCQVCGFRIRGDNTSEPAAPPRNSPSGGRASPPVDRRPPRRRRAGGGWLLILAAFLLVAVYAGPVLTVLPSTDTAGTTGSIPVTPTMQIVPAETAAHLPATTTQPTTTQNPEIESGSLTYVLRGGFLDDGVETIPYQYHRSAYQRTTAETPRYYGDEQQYYLQILNDPVQRPDLAALADQIRSITDNPDDQARIAISAVQHIPYDTAKAAQDNTGRRDRLPLEVLHDGQGLCGEKSLLLASLLRDLGFGVALIEFRSEEHMAVGIRCPSGYDYAGSGYAFVESTEPSIITDSSGNYAGIGKLSSSPVVIPLADGAALSDIDEEAADAKEWRSLQSMGKTLDEYHYARYLLLKKKYGLITTSS